MSSKQAALDLAPTAIAPTASTAKPPDKFTYALPAFTVQRRKTGWWISPTRRAPARSRNGQAHSPPSKRRVFASAAGSRSRSRIATRNRSSGTG